MNIAIIPARGGSKRIPNKNIKLFCGKPVISYSINEAKKSGCFDRILVSTDNLVIANIALNYGAEVPFIRPSDLGDDFTGTTPVVKHAVKWLLDSGAKFKNICCIYPAAPFAFSRHLNSALKILESKGCDFVFPVGEYSKPIQRGLKINNEGLIEMLNPDNLSIRSQDLEKAYFDGAQFYWGSLKAWESAMHIFKANSIPLVISENELQDIDTLEDWESAERKYLKLMAIEKGKEK